MATSSAFDVAVMFIFLNVLRAVSALCNAIILQLFNAANRFMMLRNSHGYVINMKTLGSLRNLTFFIANRFL